MLNNNAMKILPNNTSGRFRWISVDVNFEGFNAIMHVILKYIKIFLNTFFAQYSKYFAIVNTEL